MLRSRLHLVVALVVLSSATPVWASDAVVTRDQAPSTAVAAEWEREGIEQRGGSPKTINVLLGSYVAIQALDMASTIRARQAGAREVNPIMTGGYGQAIAVKAALSLGAVGAVKLMGKKNRKAATVTLLALNIAGAAVVANNMRNLQQLNKR